MKAPLRLVDPHRETKALYASAIGGSKSGALKTTDASATMPLPVALVVMAARTPSPSKASQDTVPRGTEVGAAGGEDPMFLSRTTCSKASANSTLITV
jgi:hypothetical protein